MQVITEPTKCPVLNANLLVKAKGVPTRELQGDVTAEDKINFLQEWLNAALAYGANETNHVNLLIDNVTCK